MTYQEVTEFYLGAGYIGWASRIIPLKEDQVVRIGTKRYQVSKLSLQLSPSEENPLEIELATLSVTLREIP